RDHRAWLRPTRLALVGERWRYPLRVVRRAARVQSVWTVRSGLPNRGARQRRRDVLATRAAPRRRPAHWMSRARDHTGREWSSEWCAVLQPRRGTPRAACATGDPGRERHWYTALVTELAIGALPERIGEPQRAGRQEPDVSSVRSGRWNLRGAAGRLGRSNWFGHFQSRVL